MRSHAYRQMNPYTSSTSDEAPSRESLFAPLVAGEEACQMLTVRPSAEKNDVIHCTTGPAVRFGTCVSPGDPRFFNIMQPVIPDPTSGLHRYKIFEVQADTHLPGDVRILRDPRLIGEVLADEIRTVGGAKAFGVESPAFAWFLAGGYYRLLLHEFDPHFNIDLAMKQLANLPGRVAIDFFPQIQGRMRQPVIDIVPAIAARGFAGAAMGPRIPHEGMTGTLMQDIRQGGRPIYAAPSLPCLDGTDPVSHSSLLDTWFKQIQDILADLKRQHGAVDVAFAGGGNTPIPDWFRDWCAQEGITILIIDPVSSGNTGKNDDHAVVAGESHGTAAAAAEGIEQGLAVGGIEMEAAVAAGADPGSGEGGRVG